MGYRARKRLAMLILVVGLPAYIVAAITLENRLVAAWGPPPVLAELVIFVALAFLWALPFKSIFTGIGQADPDEPQR
ncbi:MAG: DUF2842 domain-containing protein [Paracoccaceae bacterium]